MVKKAGGGNKHKKKKNHIQTVVERELEFKDEGQEYAQVVKLLGNCRLEAQCFDGKTRLGHIRGMLTKKKIWITPNDVILVSLREFEDKKCDVLLKYTPKEIKNLKILGEIPDTVVEQNEEKDEDIGFDFEEEEKKDFNIDEI